jgi:D-glycero-D-manno-heptose 1,7-bisphosphate phosphatase
MRPAVFLDRDDTLIACNELPAPPPPAARGDLIDPALVRLLPGVREALISLKLAGFTLVVVSNQGVVARGGATCATVDQVNARVNDLLHDHRGEPLITRFYFCPYHPRGSVPEFTREHDWRKPAPGMILAAAPDLGLDVARSWLIGDAERDVQAGINAGLIPRCCLRIGPDQQLTSLTDAARTILSSGGVA